MEVVHRDRNHDSVQNAEVKVQMILVRNPFQHI